MDIFDLKMQTILKYCFTPLDQVDRQALNQTLFEKMETISKYMQGKTYLIGDNICYLDFYFFETILQSDFISNGELLKQE